MAIQSKDFWDSGQLYDPPSGWKYGFPKPYRPRISNGKVEELRDTLIRDGYPLHEIKSCGDMLHVRFFKPNKS